MKQSFSLYSLTLFAAIFVSAYSSAQSGLNVQINEQGINISQNAFTTYYQTANERIVWLNQQKIAQEQWPLLFETARAGNIPPEKVWESRKARSSWSEVLRDFNIPASYFYYETPAMQPLAPPFGQAYGYYKSHPDELPNWSDQDLIKLASVKYLSDSTHQPAQEAVALYLKDPNFIRNYNKKNKKLHSPKGKNQHKSKVTEKSHSKKNSTHK